ncbi:hypothetical protein PV327_010636 [Microctonus hyperodae]|uniref:Uncharacterized protein n=1 Tax=Microctonus hyperodae TaxID=165561 RepID=A0AA39FSB6_MICHY|nr:hypothetical protein PV327_010636 [Microctonus hyperodae]
MRRIQKIKYWLQNHHKNNSSSSKRPSIEIPHHHPGDSPPILIHPPESTPIKNDATSETLRIISSAQQVNINNSPKNTSMFNLIFNRTITSISSISYLFTPSQ